jgi:hypothetical protein
MMMTMDEFRAKVEAFAVRLTNDMRAEMARQFGPGSVNTQDYTCLAHVHFGAKYARVDVGGSGKYMIPMPPSPDAGKILGIKGYGVPHWGHVYGTLDTVADFSWGSYRAVCRVVVATS